MKHIAILSHPNHAAAIPGIAGMAADAGLEVVCASTLDTPAAAGFHARGAEAALVLGGDGTMLRAAQWLGGHDLPLMGFNFGTLGYLATAADAAGFQTALRELATQSHREEKRVMLSSRLQQGANPGTRLPDALNDVVLMRHTGRLAWLECLLDGERAATYACDGLIVATPTGSTAYALSAGGPIVMPQTPALVVCPIGPHTLSSRPLVVPDTARVTLRVARARGPLVVSVDGNDTPVEPGDEVVVAKRERPLRILFCSAHNPAQTLREKLGWNRAP